MKNGVSRREFLKCSLASGVLIAAGEGILNNVMAQPSLTLDGPEVAMRTGAWYAEQPLGVRFPAGWEIATFSSATPPPLAEAALADGLEQPLGQPPLRQLARGKSRPVVIVDDLSRPTPAGRVLPLVLSHLSDAGIPSHRVTILMATGMHFNPPADSLARKVGPEIASSCRLVVHDAMGQMARLGRTALGTPVLVNPEVAASDLVIGLGGAYPHDNLGFGGGSKLMLGVSGAPTIYRLHHSHRNIDRGVLDLHCSFRKDLDEIAAIAKLACSICVHVDSGREVVRLSCGDPRLVFRDAAGFTQQVYGVPAPTDADLVVCNAYPSDVNLFIARAKALAPFYHCRPGASCIMVSACSEGEGIHGIYSPGGLFSTVSSRLAMGLRAYSPAEIAVEVGRRLLAKISAAAGASPRKAIPPRHSVWLYRPGEQAQALPSDIHGMRQASWPEALARVWEEQAYRKGLKVAVYPQASLVWLQSR